MVVKAPLLNACSWLRYLSAPDSPLPEHLRANVRVAFVVAAQAAPGQQEAWDVQDEAVRQASSMMRAQFACGARC